MTPSASRPTTAVPAKVTASRASAIDPLTVPETVPSSDCSTTVRSVNVICEESAKLPTVPVSSQLSASVNTIEPDNSTTRSPKATLTTRSRNITDVFVEVSGSASQLGPEQNRPLKPNNTRPNNALDPASTVNDQSVAETTTPSDTLRNKHGATEPTVHTPGSSPEDAKNNVPARSESSKPPSVRRNMPDKPLKPNVEPPEVNTARESLRTNVHSEEPSSLIVPDTTRSKPLINNAPETVNDQ